MVNIFQIRKTTIFSDIVILEVFNAMNISYLVVWWRALPEPSIKICNSWHNFYLSFSKHKLWKILTIALDHVHCCIWCITNMFVITNIHNSNPIYLWTCGSFYWRTNGFNFICQNYILKFWVWGLRSIIEDQEIWGFDLSICDSRGTWGS